MPPRALSGIGTLRGRCSAGATIPLQRHTRKERRLEQASYHSSLTFPLFPRKLIQLQVTVIGMAPSFENNVVEAVDSDGGSSVSGKMESAPLPLRIRFAPLFEQNIVAKVLRTAREGLVDNVSFIQKLGCSIALNFDV